MDLPTLVERLQLRWLFVGMLAALALWGVAVAVYVTARGKPADPRPTLTAVIYAVPQEPTTTGV